MRHGADHDLAHLEHVNAEHFALIGARGFAQAEQQQFKTVVVWSDWSVHQLRAATLSSPVQAQRYVAVNGTAFGNMKGFCECEGRALPALGKHKPRQPLRARPENREMPARAPADALPDRHRRRGVFGLARYVILQDGRDGPPPDRRAHLKLGQARQTRPATANGAQRSPSLSCVLPCG